MPSQNPQKPDRTLAFFFPFLSSLFRLLPSFLPFGTYSFTNTSRTERPASFITLFIFSKVRGQVNKNSILSSQDSRIEKKIAKPLIYLFFFNYYSIYCIIVFDSNNRLRNNSWSLGIDIEAWEKELSRVNDLEGAREKRRNSQEDNGTHDDTVCWSSTNWSRKSHTTLDTVGRRRMPRRWRERERKRTTRRTVRMWCARVTSGLDRDACPRSLPCV